MKLALAAVLAFSLLTSCSKDDSGADGAGKKQDSTVGSMATLSVIGMDAKPIANAKVLIGTAVDAPFVGNYFTTDAQGLFTAPAAWKSAQMVTIAADNFVTTTYMQQTPQGQTFQLHSSEAASKYELKGEGTGFHPKDGDDTIDFAVMAPLMSRQTLLSFDLGMLISPQMDTISLYGQDMQIPSNVSLPKQKESYSFLPVTLNKPVFRMYFSSLGTFPVMTIRGQFPFKKVVKELQANNQFVDLINDFKLLGGSIHDVAIAAETQNQNLPVDELVFNQSHGFHAPTFDSSNVLLAVAVSPYQGQYVLTDVKNVASNASINMTVASGETPELLTILQNKVDDQQMTSALAPFVAGTMPEMLPMMASPQVVNDHDIKIAAVTAPSTIKPAATYAVLSTVQGEVVNGVESVSHAWEVYSPSWETEIQLPQMPNAKFNDGQKRWEVSLMGASGATNPNDTKTVDLGPRMLETATHATHSATTF
jgi:hypothetical protein